MQKIPTIINNFNIYNEGNKIIGKGDEMKLPDIEAVMATIQANLGEVEIPLAGKIQKMEQEIAFQTLSKEAFSAYNIGKDINLTIRASQQSRNSDGSTAFQGIKVVMMGPCKKFEPGKIKIGDGTDTKMTFAVDYLSIEIEGEKMLEIDVYNGVFVVNGKDVMEEINGLC